MRIKRMLLSLLWTLGSVIPLMGLVRTVSLTGTQQYVSIQMAVNASAEGDTVLVYPGRYLENITIRTNNLSLISLEYYNHNPAYIDSTIIDGNDTRQCLLINQSTQNVFIRGFSMTNAHLGGGVIFVTNSESRIVNCDIYGNMVTGVTIYPCTVFLSGVRVHDNHITGSGGGIVLNGSGGTLNATFDSVNRCSVYNNTAGGGQDIYALGLSHDQNIYLDTFSVSTPSSYYVDTKSTGFDFNLNFDILHADHQEINHDLYVSPNGDDANDGLTPQTAMKTIHTAIYRIAADSLQQKTVYLLPGTYSHAANQQMFPIAMKSWVRLIGSGIGSTIINRDTALSQPTYTGWVIVCESEVHYQISGMTLASSNSIYSSGISAYHGDYISLSDLYLGNFHPGGSTITGRFLHSNWDNITIENITTNNYDGLVAVTIQGTIRNCTFRNAISTYSSTEVSTYPVVGIGTFGSLRIENCLFENLTMSDDDSRAITFGGSDDSPQNTFEIVNCIFRDIRAHNEMIYIVSHNNPIINITNCTFGGNTGNIYTLMMNGIIQITNCIFYNDTPYEISLWPQPGETTQISIDYSCVRDGQAGLTYGAGQVINYSQNNTSADPLFQGGEEHGVYNYYLSENSPCIDAGIPDTTGLTLPGYDLLGYPRVNHNRIDMGCYEWNGVEIEDNQIPSVPANTLSVYPNPFGQVAKIEYLLPKQTDVSLQIYNIKGQLVFNICSGTFAKGSHSFYWNGKDNRGNTCSSGIYFCKLRTGDSTHVRKMMLMK